MNKKRIKQYIFCAIIAIIGTIIMQTVKAEKDSYFSYDQVINYIKSGEIIKVNATAGTNQIEVFLVDGTENKAVIPSLEEFSTLISQEIENGANIEFKLREEIKFNFSSILYILIIAVWIVEIKKMMGSSNTNIQTAKSTTTFKDVAGLDEERAQFEEIVQFLKNPKKYEEMGAKIPKGILLNGEPGTGKTLLAKAIAGEAGVPFFQMSGSDFEEKFVGVGASKVRKLFTKAKSVAPAIIFIDEIDAVAQSRYGARTYSEQTLNQLLTEMDGFSSSDSVIVIAATNRMDVLDSAVLRPGRFDRHIFISKPDVIARKEILKIHAKNKKLTSDVSLEEIAQKTVGFSGADLANILNEAAIYAVNQGKQFIDNADISEAIARVLVGLEKKNASITEEDKRLTATHEAGHAIVSAVLRPAVRNFGISIVQRGNAGGYNYFDEPDAKYSKKSELEKQIAVLYGGRVAEEIILGDISSGASNDLERASKIAYLMVNKFAMNDELMVQITNQKGYNEKMAQQRMNAAERICKIAYDSAKDIIKQYQAVIEKLAQILYEREALSQEEVENFLKENNLI